MELVRPRDKTIHFLYQMSPQTKHLMSGQDQVKIKVKLYNAAASAASSFLAGEHFEDKFLPPGERHNYVCIRGLDSF